MHLCQNVLFIHAGSVYKLRVFQVAEANWLVTALVGIGACDNKSADASSPTCHTVVCVVITVHWSVLALAILLLCVLFSPLLLFMLASALISAVYDWITAILLLLRRALHGGAAPAAEGGPAANDVEGQDEGWEVPV